MRQRNACGTILGLLDDYQVTYIFWLQQTLFTTMKQKKVFIVFAICCVIPVIYAQGLKQNCVLENENLRM